VAIDIHLIAIGHKAPKWIAEGYKEYSARLGREVRLHLHEISSPRRSNSEDSATVGRKEGDLLLAAVPDGSRIVALDEHGANHTTKALAGKLGQWMEAGQTTALLIGGADGLTDHVLDQCDETWSLSKLTFPHQLVRVIVAEQIYRAVSLRNNHPYHRS